MREGSQRLGLSFTVWPVELLVMAPHTVEPRVRTSRHEHWQGVLAACVTPEGVRRGKASGGGEEQWEEAKAGADKYVTRYTQ